MTIRTENEVGPSRSLTASHLYQLRASRPEDAEFLWALKRATMRPYVEKTWGWNDPEQEDCFRRGFDPARTQIIVFGGRDAGRLEVSRQAHQFYLAVLEVLPELQGRGLGSTIVRDLQAEARAAKLPLRLQVLKTNPAAQRLYERLGFEVTGATATHHLLAWLP